MHLRAVPREGVRGGTGASDNSYCDCIGVVLFVSPLTNRVPLYSHTLQIIPVHS